MPKLAPGNREPSHRSRLEMLRELVLEIEEIESKVSEDKAGVGIKHTSQALRDMATYYAELASKFTWHVTDKKGKYFPIYYSSQTRQAEALNLIGSAKILALRLEGYATKAESYNRIRTIFALNDILLHLAILKSFCTPGDR